MILVIDAFNLIYKIEGLDERMYRGDLTGAMQGLRQQLKSWLQKQKKVKECHVFFDGKRKNADETRRSQDGSLQLYYSHDLSADHLIKEFINSNARPGELWVVSSDKQIRLHAKKHRCHGYTAEEFAGVLHSPAARSRAGSDAETDSKPEQDHAEIEYWNQVFLKRGKQN